MGGQTIEGKVQNQQTCIQNGHRSGKETVWTLTLGQDDKDKDWGLYTRQGGSQWDTASELSNGVFVLSGLKAPLQQDP